MGVQGRHSWAGVTGRQLPLQPAGRCRARRLQKLAAGVSAAAPLPFCMREHRVTTGACTTWHMPKTAMVAFMCSQGVCHGTSCCCWRCCRGSCWCRYHAAAADQLVAQRRGAGLHLIAADASVSTAARAALGYPTPTHHASSHMSLSSKCFSCSPTLQDSTADCTMNHVRVLLLMGGFGAAGVGCR